jgi:hypothetical protein
MKPTKVISCQDVGIPADQYVLGNQIDEMSDDELYQAAETTNLFANCINRNSDICFS